MPVRGWASPHLSVTASEKVIVKQKGLQCVCVCVQQFLSWASHRCAWHWLKFLSRGQSVLTVELSARRLLFLHGWMKFLLKWRLSAVTRLSRPSVSGSSCEEIFWEMLCLKEEKMLRRWILIFFLMFFKTTSENRAVMPHTCRFYVLRIRPNMRSEHA